MPVQRIPASLRGVAIVRRRSSVESARRRRISAVLAVAALLVGHLHARLALAQLSPGLLHKGHANLEGIENCTRCHEVGKRVSATKCLSCHGALAARVNAGRGLHARPGHDACGECHVEHQGRDISLIWWGDDGERGFDHRETGWRLDGKHADLDCRKCHRAEFVRDTAAMRSGAADPEHTYLGLQSDCRNCHGDPHAGQLNQECQNCHTTESWRAASTFDHRQARFPLTGLHEKVPCEKCHPAVGDARLRRAETNPEEVAAKDAAGARSGPSSRQWRGLSFANCSDCHTDPHAGRLGGTCTTCHTSQGWENVVTGRFDHDRTRYPLRGRHVGIKCNGCHRPGSPIRGLAFAACTNCHSDPHDMQFASNPDASDCAGCHTVEGYTPSTYTIARHAQTEYPLTGAHLAVPCVGCHARPVPGAPVSQIRFHYESTRCADCHEDPHKGEADAWIQKGGCEACHRVESWSAMTFDHAATRFPLAGRHAAVRCSACHRPAGADGAPGPTKLRGLDIACAACHADEHRGQFREAETGTTRCDRCHTATDWKTVRFDHNRDSAFRLDGAHLKAACGQCHLREQDSRGEWTRFKPVRTDCVACHPANATTADPAGRPRRQGGS